MVLDIMGRGGGWYVPIWLGDGTCPYPKTSLFLQFQKIPVSYVGPKKFLFGQYFRPQKITSIPLVSEICERGPWGHTFLYYSCKKCTALQTIMSLGTWYPLEVDT